MKIELKKIIWPEGKSTLAANGEEWLDAAKKAGVLIPTGCLSGSCGACEIEVNGEVVRACISSIPTCEEEEIKVDFFYDPYW